MDILRRRFGAELKDKGGLTESLVKNTVTPFFVFSPFLVSFVLANSRLTEGVKRHALIFSKGDSSFRYMGARLFSFLLSLIPYTVWYTLMTDSPGTLRSSTRLLASSFASSPNLLFF